VSASIDNCAQRIRSIRQSSRLIPTCAYVRSNNRWIWLKSVSFTGSKERRSLVRRTPEVRSAKKHSPSQTHRRTRVFVQIQQLIGKLIQSEPHLSKSIRQAFEYVIEFAAASHH